MVGSEDIYSSHLELSLCSLLHCKPTTVGVFRASRTESLREGDGCLQSHAVVIDDNRHICRLN